MSEHSNTPIEVWLGVTLPAIGIGIWVALHHIGIALEQIRDILKGLSR